MGDKIAIAKTSAFSAVSDVYSLETASPYSKLLIVQGGSLADIRDQLDKHGIEAACASLTSKKEKLRSLEGNQFYQLVGRMPSRAPCAKSGKIQLLYVQIWEITSLRTGASFFIAFMTSRA